MNNSSLLPPTLKPASRCAASFDFQPRAHWPHSLPGVAINEVQIAGFSQNLILDHSVDSNASDEILGIFTSLYSELSIVELARLYLCAKPVSWFPINKILSYYRIGFDENFSNLVEQIVNCPIGFQNWCADKKVGCNELRSLLSARGIDLKPLLLMILQKSSSRSVGVQILELGIELYLMGYSWEEMNLQEHSSAELLLQSLKNLRYPETAKTDSTASDNISQLPWPGASNVRWTRQGDRAGIEIKFFVSNPSDLKKYLSGFNNVQDLLEKDPEKLWIKH